MIKDHKVNMYFVTNVHNKWFSGCRESWYPGARQRKDIILEANKLNMSYVELERLLEEYPESIKQKWKEYYEAFNSN